MFSSRKRRSASFRAPRASSAVMRFVARAIAHTVMERIKFEFIVLMKGLSGNFRGVAPMTQEGFHWPAGCFLTTRCDVSPTQRKDVFMGIFLIVLSIVWFVMALVFVSALAAAGRRTCAGLNW